MITARQSRITIAAGLAGVTVGVTLQWLAEYLSFHTGAISLPGLFVLLSFILTFGGLLTVFVGGVLFARREAFRRTFRFCLALATVAGCLMFFFDFNVHSWNMLLAMALVCSEVIAGVVLVVAFAMAPN